MEKNLKTNRLSYFGINNNISKIELENLETFIQIEDEIWVDSSGNFHTNQINDLRFIKEDLEAASKKLSGKEVIIIKGINGRLFSINLGKFNIFIYKEEDSNAYSDFLIKFSWTRIYDIFNDKFGIGRQDEDVCTFVESDVLAIIELNEKEVEDLRTSIENDGIRKIIRLTPKL